MVSYTIQQQTTNKTMHIDLPEKKYYKIGEVAEAFNVNISLVRFWEKEFDVIKPKRNAKGNRLFTLDDIDNFKLIFNLVKERGFTLEGAKQKLRKNPKVTINNHEIISRLEAVKAELIKIRNQL